MRITEGYGTVGHTHFGEHPLDVEWSFSLTRWLTVLLLFVRARVFEHGARMRDDLLGTV